MSTFAVLALAVFFAWTALIRPLVLIALGRSSDPVRHLVTCACVIAMSWYAHRYHHPALYYCLALAGAVAVGQSVLLALQDYRDRPRALPPRSRAPLRTPPPR